MKPSMKDVEAHLYMLLSELRKSLLDIECLKAKEIGSARRNGVLHVIYNFYLILSSIFHIISRSY